MRVLMLFAFALLLSACDARQGESAPEPEAEAGPVKGVDRSHKGKPFPDVTFLAADEGEQIGYEEFRGTPTLVNLWATWCAPCVKELPTLDRLAKEAEGRLQVVPISQDMAPQSSVEAFLAHHKLDLPAYQDPKMALSGALGAEVLPTSILYDAEGRELWRYVGDLDWTGPEAAKLLAEAR